MFNTICILLFTSSGPSSVEGEMTDMTNKLLWIKERLIYITMIFPHGQIALLTITTIFPHARMDVLRIVNIIPGLTDIHPIFSSQISIKSNEEEDRNCSRAAWP